jgi:hypothetical protein
MGNRKMSNKINADEFMGGTIPCLQQISRLNSMPNTMNIAYKIMGIRSQQKLQ